MLRVNCLFTVQVAQAIGDCPDQASHSFSHDLDKFYANKILKSTIFTSSPRSQQTRESFAVWPSITFLSHLIKNFRD